jgi:hypothetical protein
MKKLDGSAPLGSAPLGSAPLHSFFPIHRKNWMVPLRSTHFSRPAEKIGWFRSAPLIFPYPQKKLDDPFIFTVPQKKLKCFF